MGLGNWIFTAFPGGSHYPAIWGDAGFCQRYPALESAFELAASHLYDLRHISSINLCFLISELRKITVASNSWWYYNDWMRLTPVSSLIFVDREDSGTTGSCQINNLGTILGKGHPHVHDSAGTWCLSWLRPNLSWVLQGQVTGSKLYICHLLAVYHWTNLLTSLNLKIFYCKVGFYFKISSKGCGEDLTDW